MRIGEAASASGVGVETIRFYEQKGLIVQPPRPANGGFRDYPPDIVQRIQFIRGAQALGFSLAEVKELLALEAGDSAQCEDVRERAILKRDNVRTRIDNLKSIRDALDKLIDACPGSGPARECSILAAISNGDLHMHPIAKGENNGKQRPKD